MCGRYVLSTWVDVLDLLGLDSADASWFEPRFNIAPTQSAPVFLQRDSAAPLLDERLRWGLIPHWAKERSFGARCINARGETAHEKPSFREAFARRRCIVPATGFYEWQREGRERLPYFVHRSDGEPMLFAGLWSSWSERTTDTMFESESVLETFTIVTRAAEGPLTRIHDRAPLILDPILARQWATLGHLDTAAAREVVAEAPTPELSLRPVAKAVNNVRHQGAELVIECVGHGVR
ncbi:SOS response-associated peptidase [Engelhardtia mirabilis]|uniref:Abasic site processing protein n=1 Tax=Engelhardtia mirabilis TaxID=2528011 RepID=A0A518BGB3_9BACT|nr:Putative SOS response-associated peptidase YedK [Planctomycetes bacterium Pla133]QDV00352.1 Putative SOS response-associated peptidase YedK [Planctomycetes bacterium Pla86]